MNPYENLALEEYLLNHVSDGEIILYLWQNKRTVVIGKNQDAAAECNVTVLERDGGFLARRLSGGGAVYHDLGNLNFTFIARSEDFDIQRQTGIILEAVRSCGIDARRSGRNDLTALGKKFSGHAFHRTHEGCFHHGTILVDTCVEDMLRYLSVSEEKLESNAVKSVRSRVVNLCGLCSGITVEAVGKELRLAAEREYGRRAELCEIPPSSETAALKEKFASRDWIFGKAFLYTKRLEHRYSWGGVDIRLQTGGGKIRKAVICSDAVEEMLIEELERALTDVSADEASLMLKFNRIEAGEEQYNVIKKDIVELICRADVQC